MSVVNDDIYISRLKAERDAERERADSLAAHIERCHTAYVKLTNAECTQDADTYEYMRLADRNLMAEFDAIHADSPATSLARRDARMKAEALHDLLMNPKGTKDARVLRCVAIKQRDEYRRQAEGGE